MSTTIAKSSEDASPAVSTIDASKLPEPISKENYEAITERFCNGQYDKLTELLPNLKNAFDAMHSIRTLDCKLCFILLLVPQLHNDALRQLDAILNLYRNLNLLKTKGEPVKYAEDHREEVVAYLVDLRVSHVLHQMALIYYQRQMFTFAVHLFMRSASVARDVAELKKKVLAIPEEELTEDEKFDLNSTFTKNVEILESEGLHMAGMTYRLLASTEEFYNEEQKAKVFESAAKLQQKSLEVAETIEGNKELRDRSIAQASFELGVCYLFQEKDEALACFDRAMEHSDDENVIENCNFHKILYYRSKDNMEMALEMYEKLKQNKNAMLLSSIYMNAKDYAKALEIIEQDIKEKEAKEKKDIQDYYTLFQLYQHLAQVYLVKKCIGEALTAANTAEKLMNDELKEVVIDPVQVEKQQDIFKAIYVEQQQYAKVLSYCIHSLGNQQLQEKVTEAQIEEILPQFAIQSKRSLLFLTETMEPESPAFYIFLMTPTGKLYFARSPTNISIEGYSTKAMQSLTEERKSESAKKEADEVLQEMYKHFISPIKEHIPTDAPLCIVTHLFQLHALAIPFSALKNPETGKHLAEEYCVELTPLQFMEQIEKIQETKTKPVPSIPTPEKTQLVVVTADKSSAEIQRFQKILRNKKLDCDTIVLGKPKKKAVLKELKTAPALMYFMTTDNTETEQNKDAPPQFGLQLNRSEILIPKDDLKKNYSPNAAMPDTCAFGHVSGTFAFCEYAHYFLQSGTNHVLGFKLVVRDKVDDKILLNEEVYPRFFQEYLANGNDAAKAYKAVMEYMVEKHDRLTWSSFVLVSRVTPLPKA